MLNETRKGHSCPEVHARRDEEGESGPICLTRTELGMGMGQFACCSARPGNGIYSTQSSTLGDKYATKLVSRKGKEGKGKEDLLLPATDPHGDK